MNRQRDIERDNRYQPSTAGSKALIYARLENHDVQRGNTTTRFDSYTLHSTI